MFVYVIEFLRGKFQNSVPGNAIEATKPTLFYSSGRTTDSAIFWTYEVEAGPRLRSFFSVTSLQSSGFRPRKTIKYEKKSLRIRKKKNSISAA